MNESIHMQQQIFKVLKDQLPSHMSFVQTMAQVLHISTDSAYRRIRGEKALSLEELSILNRQFNLSIDKILNQKSGNITFKCTPIQSETTEVSDWLLKINADLKQMRELKHVELYYSAKDPPIYQYFHIPEIAAFKIFFWEKTIFKFPKHETEKFSLRELPTEAIKHGETALRMMSKTPCVEVWNKDTFRMLLNQIEYYWISGLFETKEDLLALLQKAEEWMLHIKKQAELGVIFKHGSNPEGIIPNYKMYSNEVVLNDNSILAKFEDGLSAYITYNVLSLLQTTNHGFCTDIDNHFKGLLRISNLISESGEKERNRFFNEQLKAIETLKNRIL